MLLLPKLLRIHRLLLLFGICLIGCPSTAFAQKEPATPVPPQSEEIALPDIEQDEIHHLYLDHRPAIGLCLSGGGARGLAHIALLKAIDSLGIKVDYITGTSMGAIVGGLYAAGYSGHQMDSIARTTDWAQLFETKTPYNQLNPLEWDEYGRYIVEMPLRGERFELPSGVIEGQSLLNYLEGLTKHVAHIRNFDQLPIPFKCVAANITDGVPVVMESGSLALALRTSMSIPGVFMPMVMGDEKIMVDGGVFKNFPVDVLCDMGADLVIGGYTSISMIPQDELHSMAKILAQSANFGRIADSEVQRLSCSVFADFASLLNTQKLSAGDFKKASAILAIGEQVVRPLIPALNTLAQEQRLWEANAPHRDRNQVAKTPATLPPLQIYSNDQAQTVFKAGLHYDTEMSVGLIGTLTLRDVVGPKSRTLLSAELSENYKLRGEQRMGIKNSKYHFVTRAYYERVVSPTLFNSVGNEVFRRRFFRLYTGVQRNLGKYALSGTYFSYEQISFRPDVRLSNRIPYVALTDTLDGLVKLSAQIPSAEVFFLRQNLDQPVLPTRGGCFLLSARFSVSTKVRGQTETIHNGRVIATSDTRQWASPYTKVLLRWEHIYPVAWRISVYPRLMAGARLTNVAQEGQLQLMDRFSVGGTDWRNDWAFVPFAGNREAFTLHAAFASAQVGFPMVWKKKFFVIPQYNLLFGTGSRLLNQTPVLNIGQERQQSVSVTVGMQTFLGPIWFNVAKASNDRSVRIYSSIGLRF